MPRLTINGLPLEAPSTHTLWEAARDAGIQIPSMCSHPEAGHFASCMVCMVKDVHTGGLIPSCDTPVREGLEVITHDAEIQEARTTALELLLSEHIGDCEAPCRMACPAHLDIPLMTRHIAHDQPHRALAVAMDHIPLPSALGRICPAPCEGACHRKGHDAPVGICGLKRFAGDAGEFTPPAPGPPLGKRVAIVGAGPAGLSAGYYLQLRGIECHVYDTHPEPGGALRYALPHGLLPGDVLDRDIRRVLATGIQFFGGSGIPAGQLQDLLQRFDAVVIASGTSDASMAGWGVEHDGQRITIDRNTFQTSNPRVFAVGNSTRPTRLAVRSVAQGRGCAISVEQLVKGMGVTGAHRPFNSRIGRLQPEEYPLYLQGISGSARVEPTAQAGGYSPPEAKQEAERCMQCGCLKPRRCTLRELAEQHGASRSRFGFEGRKPVRKNRQHGLVTHEPGKCIKCGICVRLTAKLGEELGLTFMGRGFDVEIGVPLGGSLSQGLAISARQVAESCPTGALAIRDVG